MVGSCSLGCAGVRFGKTVTGGYDLGAVTPTRLKLNCTHFLKPQVIRTLMPIVRTACHATTFRQRMAKRLGLLPVIASCVVGASELLGCAGGAKSPADGQLNCQSEIEYSTRKAGATVSFMGVTVGAETEKKSIRQVDQLVEQMVANHVEMCKQVNASLMTREQYAKESNHNRSIFLKLPLVREALSAAKTPEERKSLLLDLAGDLLPSAANTRLEVTAQVLVKKKGESSFRGMIPNDTLPTGSEFSFEVRGTQEFHLYVVQRRGPSKIEVIFPEKQIALKNPLRARVPTVVPGSGMSYEVDEHELGPSQLFLVASKAPIEDFTGVLAKTGSSSDLAMKPMENTLRAGAPECSPRGVKLKDACGQVPRGVRVKANAGAPTGSTTMTPEVGDDTMVMTVGYEHVP